jgi:hypothetical protein
MARRFGKRLEMIGDTLMANVSKTVRKAAMAATNELVLRTPVLTGKARVNWRVSFGRVNSALREAPNTKSRDTNRQVASAEALIEASNKIKMWKVGKGNIMIANPVHYIFDLDTGTSSQARNGMTVFAIAAARNVLRKGRLLRG